MPTKRFDKKHWKMVVVLLANLWRYVVATLGSNDLGLSSDKRRQPDRITRSGR
ncbi:putative transmembrane anchor protein [Escherichia coli]|nr:putative transmembrane anchor protein [Escherichia coli]